MHRFAGSTNAADRHLPHSTATEDRQRQGPSPRLQQILPTLWEIMMELAESTVTGKWTRNSHRELEKK